MSHDQPTRVYTAGSSLEAYAVCNLLEAEGIEAQVVGDLIEVTQGMTPFGTATAPQVMVTGSDQARAHEVVAEWDQRQTERSQNESAPPLQFNLRFMLINMTLFAVFVAICLPAVDLYGRGFVFSIACWQLLGNLMYLAYRRKYPG